MFDENSANVCADVCEKIKIRRLDGEVRKKKWNNAATVNAIENSTLPKLFRSAANSFG